MFPATIAAKAGDTRLRVAVEGGDFPGFSPALVPDFVPRGQYEAFMAAAEEIRATAGPAAVKAGVLPGPRRAARADAGGQALRARRPGQPGRRQSSTRGAHAVRARGHDRLLGRGHHRREPRLEAQGPAAGPGPRAGLPLPPRRRGRREGPGHGRRERPPGRVGRADRHAERRHGRRPRAREPRAQPARAQGGRGAPDPVAPGRAQRFAAGDLRGWTPAAAWTHARDRRRGARRDRRRRATSAAALAGEARSCGTTRDPGRPRGPQRVVRKRRRRRRRVRARAPA